MARATNGLTVVTGASGSIGRATVRAFAARRCSVATIDRRPLAEPEFTLALEHFKIDLEDDAATAEALASLPSAESLQHVTAIAGGGTAEELSEADPATEDIGIFSRVVASNLHTAFVTIRHVVPLLRASSGNRSITLVGSINSLGGYGAPGYSAAKAGLVGLANALATTLGADGIRINCLVLGTVDTENLQRLAESRGESLDLAAVATRSPLKRVLEPADVASALVAMALDMPGLTGATVILDNGQTHIR
jgi:NAD(P)-dependent dehydrogenase (short-subunit alcohol dehydrogenase family)